MKSTHKNYRFVLFGSFILLIVIIWIFTQIQTRSQIETQSNSQPTTQSTNTNSPPANNSSNQPQREIFYYTVINNQQTSIYRFIPSLEKKKLIYFDKDETNKIARVLGKDKNQIILWEKNPIQGISRLVALNDRSPINKTVVIDNFFSANPPVLSHHHQMVALTTFSNAEKNFGFTLFVENIDQTNKRQIIHSQTNILSPAFSWDDQKIAYIVSQGAAGSKINLYDLTTAKQETVWQTEQIVTDLAWYQNGLVFIASPAETASANQAEIYQLNLATKKTVRLTNDKLNQAQLFSCSQGKKLFYIEQKFPSGVAGENLPGQIKCYQCQLNFNQLKASYLFAWEEK